MRKINKLKLFILVITLAVITSGLFFTFTSLFKEDDVTKKDKEVVTQEKKSPYEQFSYYDEKLLDRYEKYHGNNPEMNVEDIVTYVNAGIDAPFYSREPIMVEDPNALDVLVNKVYKLPNDFIPQDLVVVDNYRSQEMCHEAAKAFQQLAQKCADEGFTIYVHSGYRSYDYQDRIYQNMIANYGQEYTDQYSSKPGHSEHMTGLSCDVAFEGYHYEEIINSPDYPFFESQLENHGFILRFLEGKQNITGYEYEPWHIRYVGVDLAKEIADSNLTYEEFVARK